MSIKMNNYNSLDLTQIDLVNRNDFIRKLLNSFFMFDNNGYNNKWIFIDEELKESILKFLPEDNREIIQSRIERKKY